MTGGVSAPATPSIAIVGSGPAGLYAAEGLAKKLPEARIDVIDRLPTPYGLVRFGVAPDHQGTKAIQRQFDKLLQRPTLRFLGNVTVGRDVSVDELREFYDVVVLAVGAPVDRRLGIPGEDLAGVYGSGAFVGWFNGHPDHVELAPLLDGSSAAVIGNGNVAIDVARVLAKTPAEMAASDLCAHAADVIARADLTDIWLIGRRGPAEASWTPVELAELGRLERASPVVDAADVPTHLEEPDPKQARIREKNLEILRGFAAMPADKALRLHFLFHAAPVAVLGQGAASALRLERTRVVDGRCVGTGETFDIPAQTIVSAIGYRCDPLDGVALDERAGIVRSEDGLVAPGLWAVGWAKRGPSGTIPTNRADSFAVADRIAAALATAQGGGKGGGAGLDALLAARGVAVIDFDGWRRIEAAEAARARPGTPREKFTTVGELVDAARIGVASPVSNRQSQPRA